MRALLFILSMLITVSGIGQSAGLPSAVYRWTDLPVEKKTTGERRAIFEDKTLHLSYFEMHVTTINAGLAPHAPHHHEDEELIIVKEGTVRVTISGKSMDLAAGGVALIMANEEHGLLNIGATPATYYVLRYRGKDKIDYHRAMQDGGSRLINYAGLAANDTGKGERRNYFDQPTTATDNFEMHVTMLRKGENSHAPHTHVAEEIILVIRGEVEMYINEKLHRASAGDVIFLASNDAHALTNLTHGECEYFAFQWR